MFSCYEYDHDSKNNSKSVIEKQTKLKPVPQKPPRKKTSVVTKAPLKARDFATPPADAQKTKKGVHYTFVKRSKQKGPTPSASDSVVVNWKGWTSKGDLYDGSHVKGRPSTYSLSRVIAGWTDGIQLMHIGDTIRLWVPEKLGYRGRDGKPRGKLVFEIELLDIISLPSSYD